MKVWDWASPRDDWNGVNIRRVSIVVKQGLTRGPTSCSAAMIPGGAG